MCLAIYKPAGKRIPVEYLRNALADNPHGLGVAAARDGQLIVYRGFSFERLRRKLAKLTDCPCIVHFRLATHGKINFVNCHPFAFGRGEFAIVHNGILAHRTTRRLSDTGCFVEDVMRPLAKTGKVFDDDVLALVAKYCGPTNKLVILRRDGDARIVNEKAGHWNDGVWYSNRCYEGRKWARFGFDTSATCGRSSAAHDDWRDWQRFDDWGYDRTARAERAEDWERWERAIEIERWEREYWGEDGAAQFKRIAEDEESAADIERARYDWDALEV